MALPRRFHKQHLAFALSAVLLLAFTGPMHVWLAHGEKLGARSIQPADSTASATTDYTVRYTGQSGVTTGSVRLQFCSNSALINYPCTPPAGFDVSNVTLSNQSGTTDWAVAPQTTSNVLVLTHPAAASAATTGFVLHGVVNPSYVGSYFVRLETFASADASGSNTDYGGLALTTVSNISISTYVPPYLLFCTGVTIQPYNCDSASGDYVDFGDLRPTKASTGQTQILAATNDQDGYAIYVDGTPPTSGNNVIPALTAPNISRPGVSQFGLNLRANSTPTMGQDVQGPGNGVGQPGYNAPDYYKFNPGDAIAVASGPNDYRLYTASYLVNISRAQPAGVYVSTITYIGLANF